MADAPVPLLVVDDEVPQMHAVCDTLSEHGYAPTGFSTVREALAAITPGRFEMLLTDLTMPGMDGIALIQEALRRDPDLVCIVMTGAGTVANAVEAMKAGAFDFLLKPFRLREILPVLERALGVRRLRRENATLQARVSERTAQLEAANAELEAFSYSISHDLRAPLRTINGFTGILVSEHGAALPPAAQHLLGRVLTSAQRMDRLITDLLQFSRLGRQPVTRRAVDVAALVADVLTEQRNDPTAVAATQVRVGTLPPCTGDQVLLTQVFANLLSNAFKYSSRNPAPVVEIDGTVEGEMVTYRVRDNGVGFDPAHAQKLFRVFSRLHTTDEFPGTGIGLSIVQRIVQRHGGRIWAEAELGKGACFSFTLPVV